MTALPPINNLTDNTTTQGQAKTWFTDLRSYLDGLLGDDGDPATARTALGVPEDADDISYDNTASGLTATDVQDAIDEVVVAIPAVLVQPRADVASAATTDIGAAATQYVRITGTTTITALGTASAGVVRDVLFGGVLTFTHNATSLILPGAANITTAAGDTALMRSEGSGNWRCVRYQRASGEPIAGGVTAGVEIQSAQTIKTDPTTQAQTPGTWYDISGISVTLNGVAAGNKVRGEVTLGNFSSGTGGVTLFFKIVRNATDLLVGDAAGSRMQAYYNRAIAGNRGDGASFLFEDIPGAGNHTYKVQWTGDQSQTAILNRSGFDGDANTYSRNASRIAVREISQ